MMQHRWFTVAGVVAVLGFPALLPAPCGNCFGVVAVSRDDKVRLNVLNEVRPGSTSNLACVVKASLLQARTTPPCTGFDCSPPPPQLAESTLTLNPGQAGAIEFTPSALAFGARQSLRAVLTPVDPCKNLVVSLEVFDVGTGRLSAFYQPRHVVDPNSPPEPVFPRFGLMGITGTDTVRLNVVRPEGLPTDPCRMRVSFVSAPVCGADYASCSSPVLAETSLSLTPGQAGMLDWAPTLAAGARQSLRAVLAPTDPCHDVVTTLEVFDRTSGRTFVLSPVDPCRAPAP